MLQEIFKLTSLISLIFLMTICRFDQINYFQAATYNYLLITLPAIGMECELIG